MTTKPDPKPRQAKRSMEESMRDRADALKTWIADHEQKLTDKKAELAKIEAYLDA